MTLGMKIRYYRNMRNLTQKELGIKVGFSPATAMSRIGKYEKDLMAPKADIRKKIAEALDVDLSALSDNNIETYSDIMRTFFQYEEELGMTIEKIDGKTHLVFDDLEKSDPILMSYMNSWYFHQQEYLKEKSLENNNPEKLDEYRFWKARFPRDVNEFRKEQLRKIEEIYSPLIKELAEKGKKITYNTELILQIRKMLQAHLYVGANVTTIRPGEGALILSFSLQEMLDDSDSYKTQCFAEFLYQIETLRSYGMIVDTDVLSVSRGNTVFYKLRLSAIMTILSTLQKLIDYELTADQMEEWSKEMFETSFQRELRDRRLDLTKEIERVYGKKNK